MTPRARRLGGKEDGRADDPPRRKLILYRKRQRTPMKYISDMGYVYRLSERSYVKLLRTIAAGEDRQLDTLGTLLCTLDKNITDLSAEDAQMELDWMKSKTVED
jgi:hypothetical protein